MLNLDIRTLSFITMLSTILVAIGLQFVNRVIVRDPAFRLWTLGATASGVGYVLLAMRGVIPDPTPFVSAHDAAALEGAELADKLAALQAEADKEARK